MGLSIRKTDANRFPEYITLSKWSAKIELYSDHDFEQRHGTVPSQLEKERALKESGRQFLLPYKTNFYKDGIQILKVMESVVSSAFRRHTLTLDLSTKKNADTYDLTSVLFDGPIFNFSAEIRNGSIRFENGNIKISSKKLIRLVFILYGVYIGVGNYGDFINGVNKIKEHISVANDFLSSIHIDGLLTEFTLDDLPIDDALIEFLPYFKDEEEPDLELSWL